VALTASTSLCLSMVAPGLRVTVAFPALWSALALWTPSTASKAFLTLISQWVQVIPFTFISTVDMLSVVTRRLLNDVEAWSFYGATFQL